MNLSSAALNCCKICLWGCDPLFTVRPGFLCTSKGSTIEKGNLSGWNFLVKPPFSFIEITVLADSNSYRKKTKNS